MKLIADIARDTERCGRVVVVPTVGSAGPGAQFGPTPSRRAGWQLFDDLATLGAVAEKST